MHVSARTPQYEMEKMVQEKKCCIRDSKRQMQGVPCPRTPEELERTGGKVEEGVDGNQLGSEGFAFLWLGQRSSKQNVRHMMVNKWRQLHAMMMIQCKQQVEEVWELQVQVLQCRVRLTWIQEQHHKRNCRKGNGTDNSVTTNRGGRMWCKTVLFNGSVIWSAQTVYPRNDRNMDVYIGTEQRKREEQPEVAWRQLKEWRVAAGEAVTTE